MNEWLYGRPGLYRANFCACFLITDVMLEGAMSAWRFRRACQRFIQPTFFSGQLLGLILRNERPELESQKAALTRQASALKMELAALERRLLQALASSRWVSFVCLFGAAESAWSGRKLSPCRRERGIHWVPLLIDL